MPFVGLKSSSMANRPIKNIAFVGTGLMGTALVPRLISAGFRIKVWNRTPEKLEDLIRRGAQSASSPAEAARGADAVHGELLIKRRPVCGKGHDSVLARSTAVAGRFGAHLPIAIGLVKQSLSLIHISEPTRLGMIS